MNNNCKVQSNFIDIYNIIAINSLFYASKVKS